MDTERNDCPMSIIVKPYGPVAKELSIWRMCDKQKLTINVNVFSKYCVYCLVLHVFSISNKKFQRRKEKWAKQIKVETDGQDLLEKDARV